jgi:hypothetical protein
MKWTSSKENGGNRSTPSHLQRIGHEVMRQRRHRIAGVMRVQTPRKLHLSHQKGFCPPRSEGQDAPPPCHAPSATHSSSPDSDHLIPCILFVCEKLTPQRYSEAPPTFETEVLQPSVVGAKASNQECFFFQLPHPSLWNSPMDRRLEVPLLR